MTDEILNKILAELTAIKTLLAAQPARASSPAPRASGNTGGSSRDDVPPQPNSIHPSPESFTVPFGKNQGKTLDELSDNSLSWYCKDPEPRLDSSGKPYPPRPADVDLRNAARTLWHRRKGSLVGSAPASQERHYTPPSGAGASPNLDEESVPFSRRDIDHG